MIFNFFMGEMLPQNDKDRGQIQSRLKKCQECLKSRQQ